MHEYRRFIQAQLDERGWKPADLVNRSGLSAQTLSKILKDDRDHLGRMPAQSTLEAIATGFGINEESVRAAAARSLVDYSDDGTALTITLGEVSTDALLNEIRRRIDHADLSPAAATPATTEDTTYPPRTRQKSEGRIRPPENDAERQNLLIHYGFTPERLERYNLGDGKLVVGFLQTVHTDAIDRGDPDMWSTALIPGFEGEVAASGPAPGGVRRILSAGWIRRALARAGWVAPSKFQSPSPTDAALDALQIADARSLRHDPLAADRFLEDALAPPTEQIDFEPAVDAAAILQSYSREIRRAPQLIDLAFRRQGMRPSSDGILMGIVDAAINGGIREARRLSAPNSPVSEQAVAYIEEFQDVRDAVDQTVAALMEAPPRPRQTLAEAKATAAAFDDMADAEGLRMSVLPSTIWATRLIEEIESVQEVDLSPSGSQTKRRRNAFVHGQPTPASKIASSVSDTQGADLARNTRKDPDLTSADDYELAARDLGDEPVGRKIRRRQDEAGELPDPEGPEDGA